MTVKEHLAQVIEALPETVILEEALDCIYRASNLTEIPPAAGMRQDGGFPFAGWLGKALGPEENVAPRFTSNNDLWK